MFGLSMFFEQDRRNQMDGEPNPQRHNDQVVQIAEEGNHIWHEINGAEGINGHTAGHGFGVPGDPRVTGRQIQGQHIPSEGTSPLAQALKYRHRRPSTSGTFYPRAVSDTQVYAPTSLNFADETVHIRGHDPRTHRGLHPRGMGSMPVDSQPGMPCVVAMKGVYHSMQRIT